MTDSKNNRPADADVRSFEEEAGQGSQSVLSEFWLFLRHNKKWWLTPIIIVLLLVSILVVVGGTAAAPAIYTLF